jgi:serine phosphatase RsbU (regulator of sigma subunit)
VEHRFLNLARLLRPGIESLDDEQRAVGIVDVFAFVYSLPLAAVAIVWLVLATDLGVLRAQWLPLTALFVLVCLFERFFFRFFFEIKEGRYGSFGGTLGPGVVWAAALIFGPSALWLAVPAPIILFLRTWRKTDLVGWRWQAGRALTLDTAEALMPPLIALAFYARWGGVHPLPGLTVGALAPAFAATLVGLLVRSFLAAPYFGYLATTPSFGATRRSRRVFLKLWAASSFWSVLVDPFAVFAAALYSQSGRAAFFFLAAGAFLASLMAHRLSDAVELAQNRSRELERLEGLGRALIEAPPDGSALPDLLREHVSAMYPVSQLEIRIFPHQVVLRREYRDHPVPESAWEWLAGLSEARWFRPRERLPWGEEPTNYGVLMVPIVDRESQETVGGVSIRRRLDAHKLTDYLPSAQSLAAQIASARQAAALHRRTLEQQRAEQELAVAAEIQSSFMPRRSPTVPGWEFKAVIDSARDTSGDFIDLIPLPEGTWGLVVADVSGKGLPAALYMALSRTLIRTLAFRYVGEPDVVLSGTNYRILEDTDDDLFVTAFYGVLDPSTGKLVYASAGHHAPYLVPASGGPPRPLEATGAPLGLLPTGRWDRSSAEIGPGDALVLYTDGVTDAENERGEFFGEGRLAEVARGGIDKSALEMRAALFDSVIEFVGDAERDDDITIMVVKREASPAATVGAVRDGAREGEAGRDA